MVRFPIRAGMAYAGFLLALFVMTRFEFVRAGASDDRKSRFLRDSPRAWEEYRAFLERLQGTLANTGTLADGKLHSTRRYEFKNNGTSRLRFVQLLDQNDSEGTVDAFNPVYGFNLTRKTPDAPWMLKDLRMGEKRHDPTKWDSGLLIPLHWCISPAGTHLADLVRKPTFRVLNATEVQRDGIDLMQIDFENVHPFSALPFDPNQGGSLLLDPERSWAIREFTLRQENYQGPSTIKGHVEFRDTKARQPIPQRTVYVFDWSQLKDVNAVLTSTVEYDLYEQSNPPGDEAFTLSAFGLPEPQGVVWEKPSRWYLWFIGAAFASLGIGAYLLRRGQRRNLTVATGK